MSGQIISVPDRHRCVKNWNFQVKKKFCDPSLSHFCNIGNCIDIKFAMSSVMSKLWSSFIVDWHCTLQVDRSKSGSGNNKLRTYRLFKTDFATEDYCKIPLPYGHRSAFAKFRCGVAPLRVETGRYENV